FVVEGRRADGPNEFVAEVKTADTNDLVLGNSYTIIATESREFELVGLAFFASPTENKSLGALLIGFDDRTAQEFFGLIGQATQINVAVSDGDDLLAVREALSNQLGSGFTVLTNDEQTSETQEQFGTFIDIFNIILLVFAGIAVGVSAFIINNTFQIVVGQRIRELGLLRAIGATGKQVRQSVMLEAVIIGAVSTLIGLAIGALLGIGLQGLLNAVGFGIPSGPTELRPRTILLAVLIGMGVTVLAAIGPARKASSISPMAALRSDGNLEGTSLRRRIITGGLVTVIGLIFLANGMLRDLGTVPLMIFLGLGALVVFIGVTLLSPTFARPVALGLGRPVQQVGGVAGRLAKENAARSPRRTASTAAALMIGIAFVTMAAIVGESVKTTFVELLDDAVRADFFIRPAGSDTDPTVEVTSEVLADLKARPELESVTGYRFLRDGMSVNDDGKDVFGIDFAIAPDHLDGNVVSGKMLGAGVHDLALHVDPAFDLGVQVGDSVEAVMADGLPETLTVTAIYEDSAIYGNWVISLELMQEHSPQDFIGFMTATVPEGDDALEQARTAIDEVAQKYPQIVAEDRAEFQESNERNLSSILAVINVFLLLALLIAFLGIVNTLALSVFERTRELGLLRAVGMTRRQLRRMVRWEAVIVAVFGAILGAVLGLVFGFAATTAIPDTFVRSTAVPVKSILTYVVVAALLGIIAALLPAWRASRLNILDAIAGD
ncbi:MAG: FtsX-like permease family protein, partial [Acidimicrobiales bacterium]